MHYAEPKTKTPSRQFIIFDFPLCSDGDGPKYSLDERIPEYILQPGVCLCVAVRVLYHSLLPFSGVAFALASFGRQFQCKLCHLAIFNSRLCFSRRHCIVSFGFCFFLLLFHFFFAEAPFSRVLPDATRPGTKSPSHRNFLFSLLSVRQK